MQKIAKFLVAIKFLALVCVPLDLIAQDVISVSPAILYFNYAEYNEAGQRLDEETGILPGFKLNVDVQGESGVNAHAGIAFYDGRVEYNGKTQAGMPHRTDTKEKLTRTHLAVGRMVNNESFPFEIFFRLQHVLWVRNIQPSGGVSGLYEQYQWDEAGLGMAQWLFKRNDNTTYLTFEIFRVANPSMSVNLAPLGYGVTGLQLREKSGFRVRVDWRTEKDKRVNYGVGFFYEQFQFGASDLTPVGSGLVIREPRSVSRHAGVQFSLFRTF